MGLVDELRRARFRGAGRMAFLAHREEIAQALAAGASKKVVWQLLQAKGQMPISYARFVAYTHRYIEAGEPPAGTPEAVPSKGSGVKPKHKEPKEAKPQQFRYPGKASDKDDLV
jgi:hypothetical protein